MMGKEFLRKFLFLGIGFALFVGSMSVGFAEEIKIASEELHMIAEQVAELKKDEVKNKHEILKLKNNEKEVYGRIFPSPGSMGQAQVTELDETSWQIKEMLKGISGAVAGGTLVKMKKEVEETHKKQEVLRKEAELKRNEILEERNKQKAIYETIFRNKELQEKQVRELEQLDKKIEIALKMARGEVVGATGQYIRPTSGPVTSVYSKNRVHPVFGSVRPHNGTDFGGYYGEPIKAADGGEVTFSGWMSGYGYTVIINHGNGMATLYAHQNQSPPVSVGQTVEQAEVIGYLGSTGYSTGPHLHLEFRLNGELQDPYNYVPYY